MSDKFVDPLDWWGKRKSRPKKQDNRMVTLAVELPEQFLLDNPDAAEMIATSRICDLLREIREKPERGS